MAVSREHKRVELVVGVIVVVVVAIAYLAVLGVYDSEAAKRSVAITVKESKKPDRLDILARIQSVDTNKGEMAIRLEMEAQGELAQDDVPIIPSVDLVVFTPGTTGKQEHTLEAGRLMGPAEIILPLEGLASDYPFDKHEAEFAIIVFAKQSALPAAPGEQIGENQGESSPESASAEPDQQAVDGQQGAEPKTAVTDDLVEVPVSVALYAALPSVDLAVQLGEEAGASDQGVAAATINVERAMTVFGFVLFVMTAFWVIAIAILLQALTIASRGRIPEPDTMGYMAALLFAFPVMRDALPGTPPVGALSDFISFFWAEGIVAISLAITLFIWIRRPTGRPRWWRPEADSDDELEFVLAEAQNQVPNGDITQTSVASTPSPQTTSE